MNAVFVMGLTCVQAALRVHDRGKGIWILNGLAIRMAQSLGIHRDGERLGLPPFQSEMRRRLWWHLLNRDSRAGEDYGLENVSWQSLSSNVSLPLNIDDTDIYPDMKDLPDPKNGWTAMTFSLINIELGKSMQNLVSIAANSSPSAPPDEDARAGVIKDLSARIQDYLRYCNPVIPLHRMTLLCSRFLVRKLNFITRLQWSFLQHTGKRTEFATEENLVEALEILEPRLFSDDGLLKQFTWARKAYPQYHVTMYVLWHLCVKPDGPNVDRAWKAVDIHFNQELLDPSTVGFGSKSTVLDALKTKAASIRAKHQETRREKMRSNDGSPHHNSGEDSSNDGGLPAYLFEDIGTVGLDLSMEIDDWPDWIASTKCL